MGWVHWAQSGVGAAGAGRRSRVETEGPVTLSSACVLTRGAASMLSRAGLVVGGAAPGLGPARALSALGGGAGN